ncbi:metallophosphoesterase [Clostridium botulinum]|nr:metallophosphoesterase [Clostridium botulinum]
MTLKIGIISDIHSNYEALKSVINDSASKVDGYICLGDILGYGPEPNETIKLLSQVNLIGVVLGNHDIAILNGDYSKFRTEHGIFAIKWTADHLSDASMNFLIKIKQKNIFSDFQFEIYHGGIEDVYWQYIFPSSSEKELECIYNKCIYNLQFIGHSHLQFSFKYKKLHIVNPGSVGQPRNGLPDAQYAIFDTEGRNIEFCRISYDIKKTAEKIQYEGLDKFLAKRLFLGI